MAVVELVPATLEHAASIAARLRQSDRDELAASGFGDVAATVANGVITSPRSWVLCVDGVPEAIAGVSPVSLLGSLGSPWMVATDVMEAHQRAFLRVSRPVVKEMTRLYGVLVNYVDDRNTVSIRWLKWCGFEMGEPVAYGPFGMPFRRFMMKGESNV